jgi:hypothetical protein
LTAEAERNQLRKTAMKNYRPGYGTMARPAVAL